MGNLKIPQEDIHKRLSFLYQAAYQTLKSKNNNAGLCRYYINTLKLIARKNCIALHPNIKRTICKRCNMLLVPGLSSLIRLKHKRQKMSTITCTECGTVKLYVNAQGHIPNIDKPESWLDVVKDGVSVMGNRKGNNQGKTKQQTKSKQDSETKQQTENKQETQDKQHALTEYVASALQGT
ncbi:uncharacterized protein LOC128225098 [Mya arenaria]|uniref:uncharacterized protein LOC128225098 n=1 Tax=Mya arenaria TaxID=6604 RepID=UPI0022DF6DFE|nr:uncharacterized protein LOC128225098 [Mya arenaria]